MDVPRNENTTVFKVSPIFLILAVDGVRNIKSVSLVCHSIPDYSFLAFMQELNKRVM